MEISIHLVVVNGPKGQNKEIEIQSCNEKDVVGVFKLSRLRTFKLKKRMQKHGKPVKYPVNSLKYRWTDFSLGE